MAAERAAIIEASAGHAVLFAALQQSAFADLGDDPWSQAVFTSLLTLPGTVGLLAVRAQRPIGYVLARIAADEAEILSIGVAQEARRQGIARLLIAGASRRLGARGATALFLEVAADNAPGQAFYSALGFQPVGRRPGYYRRPDYRADALVLRRSIDGQNSDSLISQNTHHP